MDEDGGVADVDEGDLMGDGREARRPRKRGAKGKRAKPALSVADGEGGLVADPGTVDRLRSLVERIERLEEERKALADDIGDIYKECRAAGFEPKVVRQLVSIRKREPAEVEEQESLLDVYKRALGM